MMALESKRSSGSLQDTVIESRVAFTMTGLGGARGSGMVSGPRRGFTSESSVTCSHADQKVSPLGPDALQVYSPESAGSRSGHHRITMRSRSNGRLL